MILEKKYNFSAAHRIHTKPKAKSEYHLHGHTYGVKVFVDGRQQPNAPAFELDRIDDLALATIGIFNKGVIVYRKDEQLLKAMEVLSTKKVIIGKPSTTENLAQFLFHNMKKKGLPIVGIELTEDDKTKVVYEA